MKPTNIELPKTTAQLLNHLYEAGVEFKLLEAPVGGNTHNLSLHGYGVLNIWLGPDEFAVVEEHNLKMSILKAKGDVQKERAVVEKILERNTLEYTIKILREALGAQYLAAYYGSVVII